MNLTPIETRVLGSLIEKDITTPDYYPLSLNALVNACNQKNNRDPVMTLDEAAVRGALATLQERRMAGPPEAPTAASPSTSIACRRSLISTAARSRLCACFFSAERKLPANSAAALIACTASKLWMT